MTNNQLTHTLQQAQHAYTQAQQLLQQNNLDILCDPIDNHDHASAIHALTKTQHAHQPLTRLLSQVSLALAQVEKRYSDGSINA